MEGGGKRVVCCENVRADLMCPPYGDAGVANGVELETWDSNNHQQTWGVLGAALEALDDYMRVRGGYGAAQFTILDGQNEVGVGRLS